MCTIYVQVLDSKMCTVWTVYRHSWEKSKVIRTCLGWLRVEIDCKGLLGELGQQCISVFILLSTCVHYIMILPNHLLYPGSGLSHVSLRRDCSS